MTPAARAFVANAFLAPVVGTIVAYRQPSLVVSKDIAGVPVVAYAFLATLVPVVVLTALGNRICRLLLSGGRRYSTWSWCLAGATAGGLAGALAGLALRLVGSDGGDDLLIAGLAAGVVCGVAQALAWLTKARSAPDVAVA